MVVLSHEKAGFRGDLRGQVSAEIVGMWAFGALVVNYLSGRGAAQAALLRFAEESYQD